MEKIGHWIIGLALTQVICLCDVQVFAQKPQRSQKPQKPALDTAVQRHIQNLIDLSGELIDHPNAKNSDFDSALVLATEAARLAHSIHSLRSEMEAIYCQAIAHVEAKRFAKAKATAAPLKDTLRTWFLLELATIEAEGTNPGDKDNSEADLQQAIASTAGQNNFTNRITSRRSIIDHYLARNDTSTMQRLLLQWLQDSHNAKDLYNELYYTGQLSWYFPYRDDYFRMQLEVRDRLIGSHMASPTRTRAIIDSVARLFQTKTQFIHDEQLAIKLYQHSADFTLDKQQFQYTSRRVVIDRYLARKDTSAMQRLLWQWLRESQNANDLYNELYYTGQLTWYFPNRDDYFQLSMDMRKRFIASHVFSPQRTRAIIDSVAILFTARAYYSPIDDPVINKLYYHALDYTMGNMKTIVFAHNRLSYNYVLLGRLTEALNHAMVSVACVEKCDSAWDRQSATNPYHFAARVYLAMQDWNSSIEYYKKGLELDHKAKIPLLGFNFKGMTNAYLHLGRAQEALDIVRSNMHNTRFTPRDVAGIDEALGDCYTALGRYSLAEKYYTEGRDTSKNLNTHFPFVFSYAFARLYAKSSQFDKARRYAEPLVAEANIVTVPIFEREDAHLILARADSAEGNYAGAYAHLQQSKLLHDSMFAGRNTQEMAAIITQYEREKKDQDLLLKDRNIQLLTRQGQLQASRFEQEQLQLQYDNEQKQHSLQLLKLRTDQNDKDLKLANLAAANKDSDLKQTRIIRNVSIAGAIVLLLVLALVYNRYRIKQRSNKLLQELNHLQHRRLIEKEWLVKEIHHRVKNNLQIVMSLLNMQSQHLSDEYAVSAFGEVTHRMQAISLIHQKLYQTDGITHIDMPVYVREMVSYLQHSSIGQTPINFQLDVEDIQLGVAQCVPLGLILNETLTNAIKYAFKGRTHGNCVKISLHKHEDAALLTIADNGCGLPKNFDITNTGSLGFQLIETLTEQLEGTLAIDSSNGLSIYIRFICQEPSHADLDATVVGPDWQPRQG